MKNYVIALAVFALVGCASVSNCGVTITSLDATVSDSSIVESSAGGDASTSEGSAPRVDASTDH